MSKLNLTHPRVLLYKASLTDGAGDMAVAYFMVHAHQSFFSLLDGGDAAILYCFIFLRVFVL
jgi:hypothetical protein